MTFMFTAILLAALPCVTVSDLTNKELSPEICPDGILAAEVPGLYKDGNGIFNNGIDQLVFLCDNKKDKEKDPDAAHWSIVDKKFMHYNDDVLLPFICRICKKLGWKPSQSVPEYLKVCALGLTETFLNCRQ